MKHVHNIVRTGGIVFAMTLVGSPAAWSGVDCRLNTGISEKQERAGLCKFDVQKKSFEGSPIQQATCLTREVKRVGKIGDETITPFLKSIVGKTAPATPSVRTLLNAQNISAKDIGGPIDKSISANYFIIHDTSTPNCSDPGPVDGCQVQGELPKNRDDASWLFNSTFGGHPRPAPKRAAHAMTNRVGASITEGDFAESIPTTKFETCIDKSAKTKLFVGVENIQPRIGDPKIPSPGEEANDRDAPIPGFTEKQYERLALLYLVASARRGQWMVPAFHGVIDNFYENGHDDPQNFDMAAFSAAVQRHAQAINTAASAPKLSGLTVQTRNIGATNE